MTNSDVPESDGQEPVFAFLLGLGTDPPVERIDTHAASVFLAGSRAFKVKRAVRFPFLDYSTLEKRKAACEEEIKVNRPFAPLIYHRVAAIRRAADGSLSLDGTGVPVEYAVEMARFDESQTIDRLAESVELEVELALRLADAIAASHAVAAIAPTAPWIASIAAIIADNTAALRAAPGVGGETIDELDGASQSACAALRDLLVQRGRQGLVRRCHGDLHLGNIVLIERQPVLFDALEFDPVMASTDILYDVAFPIMDLLHYRRDAAANLVWNRYLARSPEQNFDALATLPLFMSMRAAVRAKVLYARRAQDGGRNPAAPAYLELAHRLIHPPAPKLVAIGGLSGTGKSVLARALAALVEPLPGAVVLRSDLIRKQRFQVAETARLPAVAYQPDVTRDVYGQVAERAGRVLSQGQSVVVDAVFARESERAMIREVARVGKVGFTGLFLEADLATRTGRVGQRQADASDATPEVARLQEAYDIGALDWARVDASGTPEQTLENAKAALRRSVR